MYLGEHAHSYDQSRRIAHHEAGHLVVAWIEGFQLQGLKIHTVHMNINGAAAMCFACKVTDPADYIRRRVRVLLAGSIAQSVALSKDATPDTEAVMAAFNPKGDSYGDYQKALELVWLLRNLTAEDDSDPRSQVQALIHDLLNETTAIVKREVRPIRRLGEAARRIFDDIDPNAPYETRNEAVLEAEDVMALIHGQAKPHEVADKYIAAAKAQRLAAPDEP